MSEAESGAELTDPRNDPGDIASAGRSCLVILLLLAALVGLICVGIAVRWAIAR